MANITHKYSDITKNFEIEKFDATKEAYKKWLKDELHCETITTIKIDDDEMYKSIYQERTKLRKEIDHLKNDKKVINSIILGKFNDQAKEIIDMLEEEDEKVTANLETYKPKPVTYELKVKTKDLALYTKLKEYAIELGLLEKEN